VEAGTVLVDEDDESLDDELELLESLALLDEPSDDLLVLDELDEPPEPRPPLKVTPTGRKTFLTGCTLPSVGWTASVSASSENACCTSMVSPECRNR
jgi:hypothetical protein